MPDFWSDTKNPNNSAFERPESHPHYGRPWLDPVGGWDSDDDDDDSCTSARPRPSPLEDDAADEAMDFCCWGLCDTNSNRDDAMFIKIHPDAVMQHDGTIRKAGDAYFNLNRIGLARFRVTEKADQAGMGQAADMIPVGSPCVDISVEGLPGRPTLRLHFPGKTLEAEYARIRGIVEAHVRFE